MLKLFAITFYCFFIVLFGSAQYYIATPDIYTIGFEKRINALNRAAVSFPLLTGKGINIGIKERNFDSADIDIKKRTVWSSIADSAVDVHATTVATLIGGAGNSYHSNKGLAYESKFFSSSFSNLSADNDQILLTNNISVQNHSYGSAIQNVYGQEAKSYDLQTTKLKNLLHIFSSGNAGILAAGSGSYQNIVGFANLSGNYKHAKNIITVGALDTSGTALPFSSRGPTYDGRVAPQITALGPNGTSDAAALVTSTVALMQQHYKIQNGGTLPEASLIKAILYASANRSNIQPLSYTYGYGRLDAYQAINILQKNQYRLGKVATGESISYPITVPNNISKLSIVLNYSDTVKNDNNDKALVNDLDVEVIFGSQIFKPLVLSKFPHRDSLAQPPTTGTDTTNTTELVVVHNPVPGVYFIKVTGKNVQSIEKQNFTISYKLDTLNKFYFTHPLVSTDIDINEDTTISVQWETANQGNGALWYKINSGGWVLINNQITLQNQRYKWPLNGVRGLIQFKMETSFGSFLSNTIHVQNPITYFVAYNCPDSARITWNKIQGTGAYNVYYNIDSSYLKLLTTTVDTQFFITKAQFSNRTEFSIEPIISNQVTIRSKLADINSFGVNCFYKTLTGVVDRSVNKLSLSLSYPPIIDKLILERIDINGSVQNIVIKNITSLTPDYELIDPSPPQGNSVYRVRILLKNGGTIITNSVSLLNNAKKRILLYPTLVKQEVNINYQQLDYELANELAFYSSNGRRILSGRIGLNGIISTKGWPKGVYFYYYSQNNHITQSGKIIVQ